MYRNIVQEVPCGDHFNVDQSNCPPACAVVAAVSERLLNAPAAMIQGSTPTLEFSGSTLISQSSWDGVSFRPGGEQQTEPLVHSQHSFRTLTHPHSHWITPEQTLDHSVSHCITVSHWVALDHTVSLTLDGTSKLTLDHSVSHCVTGTHWVAPTHTHKHTDVCCCCYPSSSVSSCCPFADWPAGSSVRLSTWQRAAPSRWPFLK